MAVYQKVVEVVRNYPAFDVVKFAEQNGATNLRDRDLLYRTDVKVSSGYMVGTVASYAIENGECPVKAYNDSVARGHSTHYIIACGTSITAQKQEKTRKIAVYVGMMVRVEGKVFEIQSAPNSNLKLVEVSLDDCSV